MNRSKGWKYLQGTAEELLRQGVARHQVARELHEDAGVSLNTASRRAHLQLAEIEARADVEQCEARLLGKDEIIAAQRVVIAGLLNDLGRSEESQTEGKDR